MTEPNSASDQITAEPTSWPAWQRVRREAPLAALRS